MLKQFEISINHNSLEEVLIDKIEFTNYNEIDLLIENFDRIILALQCLWAHFDFLEK